DPEELSAALRDLLDSPQRRAQLGEAAWRRVQERFAWPAVARATVAEYTRAIAARRGAEPGGPPPAGRPPLNGAGARRPWASGGSPSGRATGCSIWAVALGGTPSRPTGAAPTWSPSTRITANFSRSAA